MTVHVITNPNQLPRCKCRMESAPEQKDAQAWADKIGRDVYYLPSNHTAYAPLEVQNVEK